MAWFLCRKQYTYCSQSEQGIQKIHSNGANGKNTPYCRRLALRNICTSTLGFKSMQRTDKISVCNVWLKCLASSTRGQGSENWGKKYMLSFASCRHIFCKPGPRKSTGHMKKWEKRTVKVAAWVCLPSADYRTHRESWLDRISLTLCLTFLVISSSALLEKCNLGSPLESKARVGGAGLGGGGW